LANKHHRLHDCKFGQEEVWVWTQTKKKTRVEHELRSAHGHAVNYQQAYFRCSQGDWNKIMMHFTKILIIIALTLEITVARISTDGEFLFQKRLSFRSFSLGRLFFTGKHQSKTIFEYLKNLFSLICGFRFLVSGFQFLVLDSRFRFPGFRVAPSLTVCLLYIQFTHGCYPA